MNIDAHMILLGYTPPKIRPEEHRLMMRHVFEYFHMRATISIKKSENKHFGCILMFNDQFMFSVKMVQKKTIWFNVFEHMKPVYSTNLLRVAICKIEEHLGLANDRR